MTTAIEQLSLDLPNCDICAGALGQPADTVSAQQVRLMCLNTNCLRVSSFSCTKARCLVLICVGR